MVEIKSKDFHSWHIPVSLIVKWWWERLRFPTFHGFSLFLGSKGDNPAPGLQGPTEVGSGRLTSQEGEGTQVWRGESAPTMEEKRGEHMERQGHKERLGLEKQGSRVGKLDARAWEGSTGASPSGE